MGEKGLFGAETCVGANEYVYALADPGFAAEDPCRYFYVGKGRDPRRFAQAADAAHVLEATLIALLKTEGNKAGGKGGAEACLTVEGMEERYVNPLLGLEVGAPALLASLDGGKNSPLPHREGGRRHPPVWKIRFSGSGTPCARRRGLSGGSSTAREGSYQVSLAAGQRSAQL